MYVDDIDIPGNDHEGIQNLKEHLFKHFRIKDMGNPRYFLRMEDVKSKDWISISQRKYALDILEEAHLTNLNTVKSPMDPIIKLLPG